MNKQTKSFQTEGPIIPEKNYFVKRRDEINDFLDRVEQGKYIVIFAPRQTGKTTFFYRAMDELRKDTAYVPKIKELLAQYTVEVGQKFEPVVIELVYQKTAGQPFWVNRLSQILTEELDIPKTETITEEHFWEAYNILLSRDNIHFQHIRRNIKRKCEFKNILLQTIFNEKGVLFDIHDDDISELVTYGLIKKGESGYCIIDNPIYQNVVINTFNPLINGLETEYLPDEPLLFSDYVTPDNRIQLEALIDNFVLHIKSSGHKILAFPSPPQEFVGQYLLLTYLDIFVSEIGAHIYPEVSTGRGRMDIILLYHDKKYIIETKLWSGEKRYQEGKKQLARYLGSEQVDEGYYLVFDYRKRDSKERRERENIHQKTILSYCIPVL